jgi:hypothetical protein
MMAVNTRRPLTRWNNTRTFRSPYTYLYLHDLAHRIACTYLSPDRIPEKIKPPLTHPTNREMLMILRLYLLMNALSRHTYNSKAKCSHASAFLQTCNTDQPKSGFRSLRLVLPFLHRI